MSNTVVMPVTVDAVGKPEGPKGTESVPRISLAEPALTLQAEGLGKRASNKSPPSIGGGLLLLLCNPMERTQMVVFSARRVAAPHLYDDLDARELLMVFTILRSSQQRLYAVGDLGLIDTVTAHCMAIELSKEADDICMALHKRVTSISKSDAFIMAMPTRHSFYEDTIEL